MEDQQYYTQPVRSDEVYANVIQEDRIKNVIAQTSPDNQLLEIEWRVRGYRKNINGGWEKVAKEDKEPSPILISRYIAFLGSILNENTRFTNLSDIEINRIMNRCIEYLTDDLDSNAEEYNIEHDYTERTRIGYLFLNMTFFVLKRSLNGMESRRIWSAFNLNENLGNQQMKKGFLDSLKFWKH